MKIFIPLVLGSITLLSGCFVSNRYKAKDIALTFSASATENAYTNDGTIFSHRIADTNDRDDVEQIYQLAIPYKDKMRMPNDAHAIYISVHNGKETLLLVAGVSDIAEFISEKSSKAQFTMDYGRIINLMKSK